MYTQPALYAKIAKHPDTLTVYEKQLLANGTATQEEMDAIKKMTNDQLDKDFEASKEATVHKSEWLGNKWSGFLSPRQKSRIKKTGYDIDKLREIGLKVGHACVYGYPCVCVCVYAILPPSFLFPVRRR